MIDVSRYSGVSEFAQKAILSAGELGHMINIRFTVNPWETASPAFCMNCQKSGEIDPAHLSMSGPIFNKHCGHSA